MTIQKRRTTADRNICWGSLFCTNLTQPTGALDSKNGNEVITLLQNSVKKLDQTLVLITHNIDLAREADRIVRITDGKISEGEEM